MFPWITQLLEFLFRKINGTDKLFDLDTELESIVIVITYQEGLLNNLLHLMELELTKKMTII